jgi:hypothetical protein
MNEVLQLTHKIRELLYEFPNGAVCTSALVSALISVEIHLYGGSFI